MAALLCVAVWAGCSAASRDAKESRNRHMRRAFAAKDAQDIDVAIAWCEKALARNPQLSLAHRELALMLDNYREDYVGAIYHYRKFLEMRPDAKNREVIEELIRHGFISLSIEVSERPTDWQRDLQIRNDRIRELEQEVAMWRAHAAVPAAEPAGRGGASPGAKPGRGQSAATPAKPAEMAPPAAAGAAPARTHVVKTGETLGTISQQYFGTPAKWSQIFEANRDRLANANSVRVGQTLVIPP